MTLPTPYAEGRDWVLYHGDCLDILPRLDAGSVDALVTDPPYSSGGFNEAGRSAGSIGTTQHKTIEGDTLSTHGYIALIRSVIRAANCAGCYIFTDWRMWPNTTQAVEHAGHRLRGMIVWNKLHPAMGARWKMQHELVCWGTRVVSEMGPGLGNVLSFPRTRNEAHPTEKPVDLMCQLVDNAEPGTILDPFTGSGTTGVACIRTGRKFIGIEIDEHYCEVAAKRMREAEADQALFIQDEPKPKQMTLEGAT